MNCCHAQLSVAHDCFAQDVCLFTMHCSVIIRAGINRIESTTNVPTVIVAALGKLKPTTPWPRIRAFRGTSISSASASRNFVRDFKFWSNNHLQMSSMSISSTFVSPVADLTPAVVIRAYQTTNFHARIVAIFGPIKPTRPGIPAVRGTSIPAVVLAVVCLLMSHLSMF